MAQRKDIMRSVFRQLKPLKIYGRDKSQPPFTRAGPPTLPPRPPSMRAELPTLAPRPPSTRAGSPTLPPRPPPTRAGSPTLPPRPPPTRAGSPTLAPRPPPTRAGSPTLAPRPPPTRAGSPTLAPRPPPTRAGSPTLVPRPPSTRERLPTIFPQPPSMRAPLPVKRLIPQSPSRKDSPPETRPKYTDDQEEPEVMGVADFNTGLEHWWRKKLHDQTNVFDLRMIRMSLKSQLAGEQHQLSVLKEKHQIQLARLNESKPEKLRYVELTYELGNIAASYARLLDEPVPKDLFMQFNMIERCHRMARSLKE